MIIYLYDRTEPGEIPPERYEELGIDLTVPDLPDEVWLERMRVERDRLLAQSDWAMTSDAPTDKTAWGNYRQTLRDFPSIWTPAETAEFPDPPGGE